MELALNADGSLTLGADIMARLGLGPGQRVAVTQTAHKLDIATAAPKTTLDEALTTFEKLRAGNDANDPIDELQAFMEAQSCALDCGIHASIDDIQRAIERGYVEHGMRGLE